MMTPRGPFIFLVILLTLSGLASALFRHYQYGMPFLPGAQETVWQVEAKIEFRALGGPAQAIFTLPPPQSGFELVSENAVSAGYGFAIEERQGQRRAHWSKRDAQGDETLYYKLELVQNRREVPADPPPPLSPVYFDEPYQTAAATLLAAVLPRSADALTLAQQLVREMNVTPKDQNVSLLLDRYSLDAIFTALLGQANVPARSVQVLVLEDGRRRQSLVNLAQVWQDDEWHLFDPSSGPVTGTSNLLVWQAATPGVLEVENATRSRVTFSIISQTRPALALAVSEQERKSTGLSLYSLPIEEQSMFKLIMLLPVGAFVVVFLRVIVGLKTSGTFMPVLIALAFLQTELVPGVLNFILVVAIGLLIRSYLSSLNLLLVARIATLVIVVVAIMSIFSVVSYRMGLDEGLTITFFPMIILAWTIERMSILWEEDGPREVLVQGSGSLFVAVMAFLLMDLQITRHLAFNFPELHLVVLAAIMLLGRYTGYRLSELRRFAPLAKGSSG
jgi:hypothetical protein